MFLNLHFVFTLLLFNRRVNAATFMFLIIASLTSDNIDILSFDKSNQSFNAFLIFCKCILRLSLFSEVNENTKTIFVVVGFHHYISLPSMITFAFEKPQNVKRVGKYITAFQFRDGVHLLASGICQNTPATKNSFKFIHSDCGV